VERSGRSLIAFKANGAERNSYSLAAYRHVTTLFASLRFISLYFLGDPIDGRRCPLEAGAPAVRPVAK
jgi:hypothetical protein